MFNLIFMLSTKLHLIPTMAKSPEDTHTIWAWHAFYLIVLCSSHMVEFVSGYNADKCVFGPGPHHIHPFHNPIPNTFQTTFGLLPNICPPNCPVTLAPLPEIAGGCLESCRPGVRCRQTGWQRRRSLALRMLEGKRCEAVRATGRG